MHVCGTHDGTETARRNESEMELQAIQTYGRRPRKYGLSRGTGTPLILGIWTRYMDKVTEKEEQHAKMCKCLLQDSLT
jgi:hypothetical protein